MRVVFSIAVALGLVFAGARPTEASIRDPQAAQLAAAPHAVITTSLARRAGSDAGIRPLVFIAPSATSSADAPPRAWFELVEHAPRSFSSTFVATRSARGPPRSRS